jgi:beta-xylosidase
MRIRAVVLAAVAAAVLAVGAPAEALSGAPAYDGDFPDPFLFEQGGTYWAYATGSAGTNLQVISSTDLENWTPAPGEQPQDPLPELPEEWASFGLTWAPSVVPLGERYVMYYTTHHETLNQQCISVATADAPSGPFSDTSSAPLVCQVERFGSIDPSPFVAPDGKLFLLWKSDDNAAGRQTHLWAQRLSEDGLSLTGPVTRLLSATEPWQSGIIEGPSMIRSGKMYYLFYGAANWSTSTAGIGYAVCSSPLGPCTNQSPNGPWLEARPGALGPSGPATFTDPSGATRFAYHAWPGAVGYERGGHRALYIERLSFSKGRPVLS